MLLNFQSKVNHTLGFVLGHTETSTIVHPTVESGFDEDGFISRTRGSEGVRRTQFFCGN